MPKVWELVGVIDGVVRTVPAEWTRIAEGGLDVISHANQTALLVRTAAAADKTIIQHSRRELRRHAQRILARQQLLEAVHASHTVLPCPPGQTLPREEAAAVLAGNARVLSEALTQVAETSQFRVEICWDESRVLERFKASPDLSAALHAGAKINSADLSRAVAGLRDRLCAGFRGQIAHVSHDVIDLPVATADGMILNLACLVPGTHSAALDLALEQIDAVWPEGLKIRQVGPAPAASFAGLLLDRVVPRLVRDAEHALDVDVSAGEGAIAAARRAAVMAAHPDRTGIGGDVDQLKDAATLLLRVSEFQTAIETGGFPATDPVLARLHRDGTATDTGLSGSSHMDAA